MVVDEEGGRNERFYGTTVRRNDCGDSVASKDIRGELVQIGMAERWNGWTFITKLGIIVLHTLGMLKP